MLPGQPLGEQVSESQNSLLFAKLTKNLKHMQSQFQPLNEQCSSLKDYVLACKFYIEERCKGFSQLVRDYNDSGENRSIIKQLADLVTLQQLLQEDINDYSLAIERLKERIGQMEQERQQQKNELSQLKTQLEGLTHQLEQKHQLQMQELVHSHSVSKNSYEEQLKILKLSLEDEQARATLLQDNQNRAAQTSESQKQQIAKLETELKNQVTLTELKLKSLKERLLSKFQETTSELQTRMQQQETSQGIKYNLLAVEYSQTKQQLQDQVDAQKFQIQSQEAKMAGQEQVITKLQQEITLQRQYHSNYVEQNKGALSQAQKDNDLLKEQVIQFDQIINAVKFENNKLLQQVKTLDQHLLDEQRKVKEAQRELEQKKAEFKSCSAQQQRTRDTILTLFAKFKISATSTQDTSLLKDLELYMQKQVAELADQIEKYKQLQNQLEFIELDWQNKYQFIKKQAQNSENLLESYQTKLSGLQKEHGDMKTKYEQLSLEFQALSAWRQKIVEVATISQGTQTAQATQDEEVQCTNVFDAEEILPYCRKDSEVGRAGSFYDLEDCSHNGAELAYEAKTATLKQLQDQPSISRETPSDRQSGEQLAVPSFQDQVHFMQHTPLDSRPHPNQFQPNPVEEPKWKNKLAMKIATAQKDLELSIQTPGKTTLPTNQGHQNRSSNITPLTRLRKQSIQSQKQRSEQFSPLKPSGKPTKQAFIFENRKASATPVEGRSESSSIKGSNSGTRPRAESSLLPNDFHYKVQETHREVKVAFQLSKAMKSNQTVPTSEFAEENMMSSQQANHLKSQLKQVTGYELQNYYETKTTFMSQRLKVDQTSQTENYFSKGGDDEPKRGESLKPPDQAKLKEEISKLRRQLSDKEDKIMELSCLLEYAKKLAPTLFKHQAIQTEEVEKSSAFMEKQSPQQFLTSLQREARKFEEQEADKSLLHGKEQADQNSPNFVPEQRERSVTSQIKITQELQQSQASNLEEGERKAEKKKRSSSKKDLQISIQTQQLRQLRLQLTQLEQERSKQNEEVQKLQQQGEELKKQQKEIGELNQKIYRLEQKIKVLSAKRGGGGEHDQIRSLTQEVNEFRKIVLKHQDAAEKANLIIKYLNIELENYKANCNIFSKSSKGAKHHTEEHHPKEASARDNSPFQLHQQNQRLPQLEDTPGHTSQRGRARNHSAAANPLESFEILQNAARFARQLKEK